MLNRKQSILAAAVMASLPLGAKAATITFQFDPADLLCSATAGGTYVPYAAFGGVLSGTAANPILTVPAGTDIEYGVEAEVTNNSGLGIAQFQTGINNSTGSATSVASVAPAPTTIAAFFTANKAVGNTDGAGGVSTNLGTDGALVASGTSGAAYTNGANSFVDIYTTQKLVSHTTSAASVKLSLTNNITALQYVAVNGVNSTGTATYGDKTFNSATDTVGAMPTLTINYGGASSTSVVPHPIVSLAPAGTPTYGSQLGSITVVSTGPGGYVPGSTSFASATTGYVVTSTFNVGDQEVYALKLDSNGVAIPTSSTLNATIVADINALGTGSNVSAGLVSGSAYAGLFPGYDILLTSTAGYAGPASDSLDIDFSQDTDTATPGLTVVGAAAVPEPATAAGAVIGAAGLLLGRRKSKKLA